MHVNVRHHRLHPQGGFSMIEVLIALVILLVGLLGLAGLMVQSQRSEFEAYQRVQALILLQDMASRINANRKAAICYPFTSATAASAASPYLGTGSTLATPNVAAVPCTTANLLAIYPSMPVAAAASAVSTVNADLNAWHQALLGAAESVTSPAAAAGAMVGARGCITYDPTQQLTDPVTLAPIPGSGIYTISVAWQGLGGTYANTALLCGQNQYGAETQRRVISVTLRIANLK